MDLKYILIKYWGYSTFKPAQQEIITSILERKDTLAILPTGGGKSICYQLPALTSEGMCIVVSPLIALMKDQVDSLVKKGIKAAYLSSGQHKKKQEEILNAAIEGKLKLLYLSAEKLQSRSIREIINILKISFIAIDEAHCISQWGYDFRPSYLNIAEIRKLIPNVPFLALTASATIQVIEDIQVKLAFKTPNVISTGFKRENLTYLVIEDHDKNSRLLNIIKKTGGSGIVYVRSRRKTVEIATYLKNNGIPAFPYNAGMNISDRNSIQNLWKKQNNYVMVATNAFGMGIDKSDVRFVVHIDLPDSLEAYYQEAGRAGRDGKPAYSVILFDENDINNLNNFLESNYPPIEQIREIYNLIGNYLSIPQGTAAGRSFDFDIEHFSKQYGLYNLTVFSSIRLLDKQGYISLNEAINSPSTFKFLTGYEEIYKLKIENRAFEPLLNFLMRNYPGISTEFVKINELYISKQLNEAYADIRIKLLWLDRHDIAAYQPSSDKPRIIYETERLDKSYIYFTPENYKMIKDQALRRIDSVINYVKTGNKCRSIMLLHYFGEYTDMRCGKCDYCLMRNKAPNKIIFDTIVEEMKRHRIDNPITFTEITSLLPNLSSTKILSVLRWLLANEKITRTKDDCYYWN